VVESAFLKNTVVLAFNPDIVGVTYVEAVPLTAEESLYLTLHLKNLAGKAPPINII